MNSSTAAVLCDPHPSDHIVYSYADENDLADRVVLFASAGLLKNEAAILVVAAKHTDLIRQRLEQEGFDMPGLQKSGQLVFAKAEDMLASFLSDGIIDEHRFKTALGSLIDKAGTHHGRTRSVRVFGEMVDLIWTSNPDATLHLEQLWNEVIESHSVTVLCAYLLGSGNPVSLPRPLVACHSCVLSMVHWEADQRCPNCDSLDLVVIHTKCHRGRTAGVPGLHETVPAGVRSYRSREVGAGLEQTYPTSSTRRPPGALPTRPVSPDPAGTPRTGDTAT